MEEEMELTAIEIVRSLPEFQEEIVGIVPNFGGKCFDITLRTTDAATCLAMSGFDYGAERKPLKLLGVKTIHVSVFVAVEFPDQDIVKFLKQYGHLRRLCYTEDGFTSIECGILVAEFISLEKDLPRKVVTQGLEIFFKYTGQPITCYRCGSADHVVKNCPKQRSYFGHRHLRVEDRVLPGPPNPLETNEAQMESETITPSTQDSEDEDRTPSETLSSMPTPYSGVVSRDLFSEPSETSHKRPLPFPEKSGNPEPKKAAASNDKPATAAKPRRKTPAIKFLKKALHQTGPE